MAFHPPSLFIICKQFKCLPVNCVQSLLPSIMDSGSLIGEYLFRQSSSLINLVGVGIEYVILFDETTSKTSEHHDLIGWDLRDTWTLSWRERIPLNEDLLPLALPLVVIKSLYCVDVFLCVVSDPTEHINVSLLERARRMVMSPFVEWSNLVPQVQTYVVHLDALRGLLRVLSRPDAVNELGLNPCQSMPVSREFEAATLLHCEVLCFDLPWLIHGVRDGVGVKGTSSN